MEKKRRRPFFILFTYLLRCVADVKKSTGKKIIMGFSSITGIPDQIFTPASTRYSFFLLFIRLFFPYHLFIHSSRAEWQGQQQHLMQSPPTPGAILHYDRAFRDESLLRIKDRRMGGDAGLWAWCTGTDGASDGIIHKARACTPQLIWRIVTLTALRLVFSIPAE